MAERALLDWIPVNSRLSAVWLDVPLLVGNIRLKGRCLFVIPVYAPSDCNFAEAKDYFYRDLCRLL